MKIETIHFEEEKEKRSQTTVFGDLLDHVKQCHWSAQKRRMRLLQEILEEIVAETFPDLVHDIFICRFKEISEP